MALVINEDCFVTFERLPDNSVDIVFTSPPYNRKRNDKYTYYDDTIKDYFGFLVRVIQESMRVARGHVFINIQKNYYNNTEVFRLIGEFAKELKEVFVWGKTNPVPAAGFSISNSYEFILCFGDKAPKSNTTYTKNLLMTSVGSMRKEHRAVMKQEVADYFIGGTVVDGTMRGGFCQAGDVVFDPFMGTGTTALACQKIGAFCIGSEIVPEYCGYFLDRVPNSFLVDGDLATLTASN